MTAERVHEFLDDNGVGYDVQTHDRAVTAQELAAAEHVTGWDVAKPVILEVDGDLVMVVVPAATEVDLDRAAGVLDADSVDLAEESRFAERFPDCETGAEPPFGNLYDMPVYLDRTLREREQLVCRDGSHTETLTLDTEDFVRIVDPVIVDVTD